MEDKPAQSENLTKDRSIAEGATMTPERPKSFEEVQVGKAVAQAQAERKYPWLSPGAEAVARAGEIKGPEDLPPTLRARQEIRAQLDGDPLAQNLNVDPTDMTRILEGAGITMGEEGMISLEARERMARHEQLRYYEGSLLADTLRRTYDPKLLIEAARIYMAQNEEVLQMPDTHRIALVYNQLVDRAAIFAKAQDPRWRGELEERGLLSRKVNVPNYQVLPGGRAYEVYLNQVDKATLSQIAPELFRGESFKENNHGGGKLRIKGEYLDDLQIRSQAFQEILERKREIEVPGVVAPEKLPELAQACERMKNEIWVRERVFVASVLYSRAAGLVDESCKLFEQKAYSEITSSDWQTLFWAEATKEGEKAFGEKIDMAMRLYTLIGYGGGAEKTFPEKIAGARQRIERQMAGKPWVDAWLVSIGKNRQEFLDEISVFAARNIFCEGSPYHTDRGQEEWVKEVRDWARSVIGGDKDDTKASEELGWRIFYMWGLATHFDGKSSDQNDATVGWPGTDDRMKLEHFETWRRREAKGNHNEGPHATRGKYNEMAEKLHVLDGKFRMSIPFLHYALPQVDLSRPGDKDLRLQEMKTFWEKWWNDGVAMKDLPWKSIREYTWWYYNLATYFAGGYGEGRGEGRGEGKSLFSLLTRDSWKREELINIHTLQDIVRTVEYAMVGSTVTGGEIQKWLQSLPADKRQRAEILNNSDFTKTYVEPVRKRIRELILYGAITSAYQGHGRWTWTDWGEWVPGGASMEGKIKAEYTRKELPRILADSKFDIDLDRIKKEAEKFLKDHKALS